MTLDLSSGALARIYQDQEAENPVMQLLGYKPAGGRFWLDLSDGEFSESFFLLDRLLHPLINNHQLELFTIIKIKRLTRLTCDGAIVVAIHELELLTPGQAVGVQLGNPRSIGLPALALSSGMLERMISQRAEVTSPVLQMLSYKIVSQRPTYRLCLSDGSFRSTHFLLSEQLNCLMSNNSLQNLTVIQLDDYGYISVPNYQGKAQTVVLINQVKILHTGSQVGVCLGSPARLRSEAAVVVSGPCSNNNNRPDSQELEVKVRPDAVIPECKVCLQTYRRGGQIYSCSSGHLLCGSCRDHPAIKFCPRCRRDISGRARDFEDHINDLWG